MDSIPEGIDPKYHKQCKQQAKGTGAVLEVDLNELPPFPERPDEKQFAKAYMFCIYLATDYLRVEAKGAELRAALNKFFQLLRADFDEGGDHLSALKKDPSLYKDTAEYALELVRDETNELMENRDELFG